MSAKFNDGLDELFEEIDNLSFQWDNSESVEVEDDYHKHEQHQEHHLHDHSGHDHGDHIHYTDAGFGLCSLNLAKLCSEFATNFTHDHYIFGRSSDMKLTHIWNKAYLQ